MQPLLMRRSKRSRVMGAIYDAPIGGQLGLLQEGSRASWPWYASWLAKSMVDALYAEEPAVQHVIIETPKPAVVGLRAQIQNFSAISFRRQPKVLFISFDDASGIERSPHGVPVLASMFQAAIEDYPQASTFTYVNSDIAVDESFVRTADAMVAASRSGQVKPRFLMVGRRTNVNFNSSFLDTTQDDLSAFYHGGSLFRKDAEDYFMVVPASYAWDQMPRFIVGHRGFDNWLVSEAATNPDMDLVDASSTLRAMHLTDERVGNKEGHKGSPDGVDYNMILMGSDNETGGNRFISTWLCGTTGAASFRTQERDGKVELLHHDGRPRCMAR